MAMELNDTITRLARGDGSAIDQHGWSVARIAVRIAVALGFNDADRAAVRLAASLHDIGKQSIPAKILAKAGPLSEAERGACPASP